MKQTIEMLRGELERLFSLDELVQLSESYLGLRPDDVGGASTRASFAQALVLRCTESDRLDALVDVVSTLRRGIVDQRLGDPGQLFEVREANGGATVGPFVIQRKLGESALSYTYAAKYNNKDYILKTLKRTAVRDRLALQRFLAANRLINTLKHRGLPEEVIANELADGVAYVAYRAIDAQPLSARFARTGASHINELKPLLRAVLEPLAVLHAAKMAHGDIKMDNILVGRGEGGEAFRVMLVDFGVDRLRTVPTIANGYTGFVTVFGSPKTAPPEVIRGEAAVLRSDVYSFGAMLYELLTGKPVFAGESSLDIALAHIHSTPELPSVKAPRGWVSTEVDEYVLSLLAKDPSARPADAAMALEGLLRLGQQSKSATIDLPALIGALESDPASHDATLELAQAVDNGVSASEVAAAFDRIGDSTADDIHVKKSLWLRAARLYHGSAHDSERAEASYMKIVAVDGDDEVALAGLEDVRRALGKFPEIVESLVERSERAARGAPSARLFVEIGHLCARELDDTEQALVAYSRALVEAPTLHEVAETLERLAGDRTAAWTETLQVLTEGVHREHLSAAERNELLVRIGTWYGKKVARHDLALAAFQQVLKTDPANDAASAGITEIYRRAEQWPELAQLLASRAESQSIQPRARDLRVLAAEVYENKLSDLPRAKELYLHVLDGDPLHERASAGFERLCTRTKDFSALTQWLERRSEMAHGADRVSALCRLAEVYEDHIDDLGLAERFYREALSHEPHSLPALKGLDRVFNRTGKYRELLENLRRQVDVAATPRQRIGLLDRVAALLDEEFVDHAGAVEALEAILATDPMHEGASTKLQRLYRTLSRWEDLATLLDHLSVRVDDAKRQTELWLLRAKVLAENVGAPERALHEFERVLELDPKNAAALEGLTRLRVAAGDTASALASLETLLQQARSAEERVDVYIRVAKMLEDRGDIDSAIERYKAALEVSPTNRVASQALRRAFVQRGDAVSVVSLLEKELDVAESPIARARLYGELARVSRERLHDAERAEQYARRAVDLDPTNEDAILVLGDAAYEHERYKEAAHYYDGLIGRARAFTKADALRVLLQFMESAGRTTNVRPPFPSSPGSGSGSAPPPSRVSSLPANPRLTLAVETVLELAENDAHTLSMAGRVAFEHGEPEIALKIYQALLDRAGQGLTPRERAQALFCKGDCLRRLSAFTESRPLLEEACRLDPHNGPANRSLARLHEDAGEYDAVVRLKTKRLETAVGDERFELLLDIGDTYVSHLNDRPKAARAYVQALEERPDDRRLLTKLMQLYSEEKDWAKLVDVVTRLAEFVDETKQRAKYMQTAAIVLWRQLGDADRALEYFDKALELDPTLNKALDEAAEIRRQRGDAPEVERLLKVRLERAKQEGDREQIINLLDELGGLYAGPLEDIDLAVDALEAAQAFAPDNRDREDKLAALYTKDVTKYLDKAAGAHLRILKRTPYHAESYKALRKLYTDGRRADSSWLTCQALSFLDVASPDEARFFEKHRAENAAPAQAVLTEEDWLQRLAADAAEQGVVTQVFQLIQPAVVKKHAKTLETLGYDPRYALDVSRHPYPASQMLHYAAGVLAVPVPPVFQENKDPGGFGFIPSAPAGILLGRAAFEAQVSNSSLAFLAGRQLTFYRPGYLVRQLVPNVASLKTWLFAAIKLAVPQFPLAPDMATEVSVATSILTTEVGGSSRDKLVRVVNGMLEAKAAVDLKRWIHGVDQTADRVGFLLAHDLRSAADVIRASDEANAARERVEDLLLFCVSEEYQALRARLGIAIDSGGHT